MSTAPKRRHLTLRPVAVAGLSLAVIASTTACTSAGKGDTAEPLSFLVASSIDYDYAKALVEEFTELHPDMPIEIEVRPTGTEGENLVKTKLSTGEMEDIFVYNSGALLQTLAPDKTMVDLTGQAELEGVDQDFLGSVTGDDGVYGVPWGSSRAGGIVYSKLIYRELGLSIPTTWDEFERNNELIAEKSEATPVLQSYGDPGTAQIPILADFGNVQALDSDWAAEYTANKRRFADQPGLSSFEKLESLAASGWLNEDFASIKYDEGVRRVLAGEAAHYPILTNYVTTAAQANYPDLGNDVGFFAMPSSSEKEPVATLWLPLALYMSSTIDESKLDTAHAFLKFVASADGCRLYAETSTPAGPFMVGSCEMPDSVFDLVKDIDAYYTSGDTALALEYVSPVKGANLAQFAVEVGSSIRSAADAAALYDEDVRKQAEQLGLEGW